MKKADLYNHIEKMTDAQLNVQFKEREKQLEGLGDMIEGLLSMKLVNFDSTIGSYIHKVEDLRDSLPDLFTTWRARDVLNTLNTAQKTIIYLRSTYTDILRDRMLGLDNSVPVGTPASIAKVYEEIKPKYLESLVKEQDVNQLSKELNAIVKAAKSAKEAHKILMELGLDMTDLKVDEKFEIAQVTLSKDICVLNGGCK